MSYRWNILKIPRLYGLDLKSNPIDVKDSLSLNAINVFQDKNGVVSKRFGFNVMFDGDETATTVIKAILS